MKDLAAGAQLSSLEISFFLKATAPRTTRLKKIVKELKRERDRHGPHWFAASFLPSSGTDYYLYVHVDEDVIERERTYYVEVKLRGLPEGEPPSSLRRQAQKSDWAFNEVAALIGNRPAYYFFEAELRVPNMSPPTRVVDLPLTVSGRPLPVRGVEYGSDEFIAEGVTGFRWSLLSSAVRFNISYVRDGSGASLKDVWNAERLAALGYIEEALER